MASVPRDCCCSDGRAGLEMTEAREGCESRGTSLVIIITYYCAARARFGSSASAKRIHHRSSVLPSAADPDIALLFTVARMSSMPALTGTGRVVARLPHTVIHHHSAQARLAIKGRFTRPAPPTLRPLAKINSTRHTSSPIKGLHSCSHRSCVQQTEHNLSPDSGRPAKFAKYPRHAFRRPKYGHLTPTSRSGFAGWTIAIVVIVGTGAAIVYPFTSNASINTTSLLPQTSEVASREKIIEDWSNMTGESLPGRPGTLTAHEEEKLREFWAAVLQVFGVKETQGSSISQETVAPSATAAPEKEKRRKKALSIFSRKKDQDSDSVKSADSSASSPVTAGPDGEDKHGQTKQYHEALASQTPESLRATFWSMVKHDHPDALLLRFLRARKWDVEKALIMMVSTMHWRSTDMKVDADVVKNGECGALVSSQSSNPTEKKSGEDFLAQVRMGKSFLHGSDKSGRPMCYVRVRLHKQGEQSEESLERYTVYVIETARMMLSPPVDTAVS